LIVGIRAKIHLAVGVCRLFIEFVGYGQGAGLYIARW
jgi:hypothetical protein